MSMAEKHRDNEIRTVITREVSNICKTYRLISVNKRIRCWIKKKELGLPELFTYTSFNKVYTFILSNAGHQSYNL